MVSRSGSSDVHTRHVLPLRNETYSVGKRVALYPKDCLTGSLHQLLEAVNRWDNKDLLSVSSLCMSNSRVPRTSWKQYFLLLNVCFTQRDNSCCAKWELLDSPKIVLPSTEGHAPVCLLMLLFQLVSCSLSPLNSQASSSSCRLRFLRLLAHLEAWAVLPCRCENLFLARLHDHLSIPHFYPHIFKCDLNTIFYCCSFFNI